MEKLLLIIFWVIITYYAFRLAIRYLLPWIVRRYMRKMQRNMHDFSQQQQNKDGSMNIKYGQQEEPKIDPDLGEYVDFEEIEDNNKTE